MRARNKKNTLFGFFPNLFRCFISVKEKICPLKMGLVDFRLICSTCILIMSYVNRFARNYILWLLVARFLSFSLYFLYHTASTLPLHYFLLLCVSTSVRPFKYRNKFICTSGAIAKHALTIWIKTAFDCSKEPHCVATYGRPACELLKE